MTSFAHSGSLPSKADWQSLDDHLRATASLAAERAAPMRLSALASVCGALHDFGKHDPAFQRRLEGQTVTVDHSTAGGALLLARAKGEQRIAAELLAYAILGHHAGLPDRNGSDSSIARRLERHQDRIPDHLTAQTVVDLAPAMPEIAARIRPGPNADFDLSVLVRMVFSCLVDADFRDTEAFYDQLDGRQRDRDWHALQDLLPGLRAGFDARMAAFPGGTDLNLLRAEVLAHIRAKPRITGQIQTSILPRVAPTRGRGSKPTLSEFERSQCVCISAKPANGRLCRKLTK